jgi:DNA-binding NtrC family response regulator
MSLGYQLPAVSCGGDFCFNSTSEWPRDRRESPARTPVAVVIDDEHIIADTIAQILRISGIDAVPHYSGAAALEAFDGNCPDLIISDVVMPDLDGIETAKSFLKRCPSTRILLLSGQASTAEIIQKAQDEGYNFQLLAKPLHPEDLLGAVRRCGF